MMDQSNPKAVFAIPGDINRKTGGFIYEQRLLLGLCDAGWDMTHLQLGGSFPEPTPQDMTDAIAALGAVPADQPVIIDGLVFGSVDTAGLDAMRAPICAMIHHPLALETGLDPYRARELATREAANLERAAHVLVPSPHTAEILRVDYGVPSDRITIAPPGISRASQPRAEIDPPLILSVGLLARRKGHDVLLEALASIRDLAWQAEIVGDAHDPQVASDLMAQRSALGLEDRVSFAGLVSADHLNQRFHQATLFALATRYEGYGMVFAEALSCGVPIVTCRTGAVPDTVPASAGTLVPADDPEAFAAALRQMLTDTEFRSNAALAAAAAGCELPGWADTAAIAGTVLAKISGAPRD